MSLNDVINAFFVAESIVSLLIISINSMVLSLFVGSKNLCKKHLYLVQLSISDFLVGLVIPTFTILSEVFHLPNTFHLCILSNSTINLLTSVSVLTLCVLSVRSLIAVRYKGLKKFSDQTWVSYAVMLFVWLVAGVENILMNFLWHEPVEKFNAEGCRYRSVISLEWSVYINFIGFYVVVVLSMSVIYFLIFMTFRHSAKTVASKLDDRRRVHEHRLARSVFVIFIVLTVTWLPIHLVNLVTYLHPNVISEWGIVVYLSVTFVAIVLSHLNSFLNALVYCLGCRELRRRFISKYPFTHPLLACCTRKLTGQAEQEPTSDFVLGNARPSSFMIADEEIGRLDVARRTISTSAHALSAGWASTDTDRKVSTDTDKKVSTDTDKKVSFTEVQVSFAGVQWSPSKVQVSSPDPKLTSDVWYGEDNLTPRHDTTPTSKNTPTSQNAPTSTAASMPISKSLVNLFEDSVDVSDSRDENKPLSAPISTILF